MRTLEEFNQCFSDKPRTCFIIGSGPSIHGQDLRFLKQFVTIAVNSGYLAHLKADFFVSDDAQASIWSYFFHDLYNSRYTIPILYADKLQMLGGIFGKRRVVFRHRTGYHLTDTYEP